jgi:hypothetical protein
MSQSEEFALAVILLAPLTVLGLAGMARGYHLHIRVWRDNRKGDSDNGDNQ